MLLPEARLDALLDQLRMLPTGDRKAVLARLSPPEREQIRARLRGEAPPRSASPWSADIAHRVEKDSPLTAAGRAALARAVAARRAPEPEPAGSLFDALAARFWPRAR
ncbi:MAG: hypothetical protein V4574_04860 [Pseudomonadota bacterium]